MLSGRRKGKWSAWGSRVLWWAHAGCYTQQPPGATMVKAEHWSPPSCVQTACPRKVVKGRGQVNAMPRTERKTKETSRVALWLQPCRCE